MSSLLVNGMMRSGTTHALRVFAADPYFERVFNQPLHEELPQLCQGDNAWERLYHTYTQHPDILEAWKPTFASTKTFLSSGDEYPGLEVYLKKLIKGKSLLKFVCMNLRLGWLHEIVDDCHIMNIVRNPRAVCYSALHYPASLNSPKSPVYMARYYDYCVQEEPEGDDLEVLKATQDSSVAVKILALWVINVRNALRSIEEQWGSRCVTVRHEDVCTQKAEALQPVYSMLGREISAEVRQTFEKVSSDFGQNLDKKSTRRDQWMQPTSTKLMNTYNAISADEWNKALDAVPGIRPLMEQFNYNAV